LKHSINKNEKNRYIALKLKAQSHRMTIMKNYGGPLASPPVSGYCKKVYTSVESHEGKMIHSFPPASRIFILLPGIISPSVYLDT